MIFANSVALWLLALIPVVALAHFVKKKPRARRVASMFLWEETLGRTLLSSRSFRVRNFFALLTATLIATALVVSLANPTKNGVGAVENGALVIVLDNSRSMSAVEGGRTRFEAARDFVRKTLFNKSSDVEALVLTTGGACEVVCGFTNDRRALSARVAGVEPSQAPCAMTQTLETARFFQKTRPNAKILVVSDGCFRDAERLEKTGFNDDSVVFERIGGELENVGITAFEARRSPTGDAVFEAMLEVANFSATSVDFEAELFLDGAIVDVVPFQLGPGERVKKFLKNESTVGGELTASLRLPASAPNALTIDDAARTTLPDYPTVNVLLFGGYDRFALSVFDSLPNVEVREITEIPAALEANELLVAYGDMPSDPPPGKVVWANPTSDGEFFSVGDEIDETFADSETREGPPTRFLNFDGTPLRGVRTIDFKSSPATIWVKSPEAPLIFSSDETASRIVLNFSCSDGALPLRALFPILFANVVGVARGESPEIWSDLPDEASEESNLTSRLTFDKTTSCEVENNAATSPAWWRWFALAALTLILLEFYWFCRRFIE